MKYSKHTITVKASADHAWKTIGEDFVAVERWMAAHPTAEAIPGPALPGAPAKGRYSYLIQKFQPVYQEEIITAFSNAKRSISTRVTLKNTPKLTPMLGYEATITVQPIDDATCRIDYVGAAMPKWFGKPITGALTKGLDPGFLRGVEELAHYVETGAQHPRKLAKLESEAALSAA